jgi:hypothetical protein
VDDGLCFIFSSVSRRAAFICLLRFVCNELTHVFLDNTALKIKRADQLSLAVEIIEKTLCCIIQPA